jgi:hypothetical protein
LKQARITLTYEILAYPSDFHLSDDIDNKTFRKIIDAHADYFIQEINKHTDLMPNEITTEIDGGNEND